MGNREHALRKPEGHHESKARFIVAPGPLAAQSRQSHVQSHPEGLGRMAPRLDGVGENEHQLASCDTPPQENQGSAVSASGTHPVEPGAESTPCPGRAGYNSGPAAPRLSSWSVDSPLSV